MYAMLRSMFRYLCVPIAIAGALLSTPAFADDFDDAEKAYARKNFANAMALYRKAATQGDVIA